MDPGAYWNVSRNGDVVVLTCTDVEEGGATTSVDFTLSADSAAQLFASGLVTVCDSNARKMAGYLLAARRVFSRGLDAEMTDLTYRTMLGLPDD